MFKTNYTTIPTNGLVLDLPLNGNANARVGNNGTATNIVWVPSEKGYTSECASLNGSSSYVNMGNTTLSASTLSVSIWVNLNADTGGQQWICSQEGGTLASTNSFYFRWLRLTSTTGYWNFGYRTTSGTFSEAGDTTPINIPTSQWFHLVATQDTPGGELKLYVNGAQSGSTTTISLNRSNNTTNLRFGQRAGGSGSNVNGLLGLGKIYNGVLSQQEITNLYQEGLRELGPSKTITSNGFKAYSTSRLENGKILEISKPANGGVYYDQTSNGNNSVSAVSVTDSTDGVYNVMSFNGSSSYVQFPEIFGGLNKCSLKIRINSNMTGDGIIAMEQDASSSRYNFGIWHYSGFSVGEKLALYAQQTDDSSIIRIQKYNEANFMNGKWNCIFIKYNSSTSTLNLYLNGVLQTPSAISGTIPTSIFNGTNNFILGKDIANIRYANMSCCNFTPYNRDLSDEEILEDYYSNFIPN